MSKLLPSKFGRPEKKRQKNIFILVTWLNIIDVHDMIEKRSMAYQTVCDLVSWRTSYNGKDSSTRIQYINIKHWIYASIPELIEQVKLDV